MQTEGMLKKTTGSSHRFGDIGFVINLLGERVIFGGDKIGKKKLWVKGPEGKVCREAKMGTCLERNA